MAQSPLNQARNGEKLTRLLKNKDFKELILDGFLHDFALEMSYKYSSPIANKEYVNNALIGISVFKQYLDSIREKSEQAYSQLSSQLRNEEEI